MTASQQFLIYQSEDGSTRIDVMLEAETLWLSQKQLTELFGKAKGTISEHIKHIFEDGELDENSVVRFFRTTAAKTTVFRSQPIFNQWQKQLFGYSEQFSGSPASCLADFEGCPAARWSNGGGLS